MSFGVQGNGNPNPGVGGQQNPEKSSKDAFSGAEQTLKNLIDLLQKQGDSQGAAQLAQEAKGVVDSLSTSTSPSARDYAVATAKLKAAIGFYNASKSNPKLDPPHESTLSEEIQNTLRDPSLITELTALLSLVQELMRKIQQEEAKIQAIAMIKSTDQAVAGAEAEKSAGAAQAAQTILQSKAQIVSAVSNFLQGGAQIYSLRQSMTNPKEVNDMEKTEGAGNPKGELAIAKDRKVNNEKLLELKSEMEKKYPADPQEGTSIQRINKRLNELDLYSNDNDPGLIPPGTPTERADLNAYRNSANKFLRYHPEELGDPTRVADPANGTRAYDPSMTNGANQGVIPDLNSNMLREHTVEDQKTYNSQTEYRTTLLSKHSSKSQAISGLISAIGGASEKLTEGVTAGQTAEKQKEVAAQNALKQIEQTAQGLMQSLQQMSEKGKDGIMQSISSLIQLAQAFIQNSQQNWQR